MEKLGAGKTGDREMNRVNELIKVIGWRSTLFYPSGLVLKRTLLAFTGEFAKEQSDPGRPGGFESSSAEAVRSQAPS